MMTAAVGCGSSAKTQSGTVKVAESVIIDEDASTTAAQTTAAAASTEAETTAEASEAETTEAVQTSSGSSDFTAVTASYYSDNSGLLETADLFTERDLAQTVDVSEAVQVTAADGETLNITEAGIYVISGTAENCTIKVEVDSEEKVQLVLDGVSITNEDFPAIYVVSADKCFITTTEGSVNSLSVTGNFTADGETNTDAVIFSKDDIVLNGLGSLDIYSAYGNGISCKDDLKVTGGTYTINCAKDAVEANDSIAVCGGSFTINTNKDGLHCENDEDDSVGSIFIADGSFTISASSDGIQGTTVVQIDGGEFNITSSEGIEATYIQINGGTINIDASDDGINAARKSSLYTPTIEFNGGYTTVSMGQGDTDAIDANGYIYVNGGTIDVTAPTSSFDYDMGAEYNGGTIIINGEQVSEIPEEMMGGGMGGFGGGRGGFGGGFGGHV